LDRQAAYEQTKEEVDKWTETMKRIREVRISKLLIKAPVFNKFVGGASEFPTSS